MKFSIKLDALMNLVGATNSKLARHLQVDPSLISRWRNGSRKPTKDQAVVQKLAVYFVSQVITKHDLERLGELIGKPDVSLMQENDIIEQVFLWLRTVDTRVLPTPTSPKALLRKYAGGTVSDTSIGTTGRESVLKKLFENIHPDSPNTPLYFYSNDLVDLLAQDIHGTAETINKNLHLLDSIGDIKIIINDNATAEEVEFYLTFLTPFLENGRLFISQNPHYHEEAFSNSVLIVGDQLAAASYGFSGGKAYMTNFFTDQTFISQLTADFLKVFDRGTPLHETNWNIDLFEVIEDSMKFWINDKPVTFVSNALAICYASPEIVEELATEAGLIDERFIATKALTIREYFVRYESFLEHQDHLILLPLFSVEEIRDGAAKMICLPRFEDDAPLIDEACYLAILKCLYERLLRHEHLLLKVIPEGKHEYAFYLQKNDHSLVTKNIEPYANYTSMSPAFVHGMNMFINKNYGSREEVRSQRDQSIETLKNHIAAFEKELESTDAHEE